MRWKMSDDSKSMKWSTMTKCHLPWTHSVFCHSKDKSLTSEWWSQVFFLLRNRDLTLCVINDLCYYFDWMCVCYILNVTDFSSNAADLKSIPVLFSDVCAAWKLPQWHPTAVSATSFVLGMTRWHTMLLWSKGKTRWPLKVPFRICGGLWWSYDR